MKTVSTPPLKINESKVNALSEAENLIQQPQAVKKRKTSYILASAATLLVVAALACAAIFTFNGTSSNDEYIADNYTVEHITDRISSKLSNESVENATASSLSPAAMSDTGYRVRTRTLVTDATKVFDTDTIEDVYSGTDEEIVSRLLYQQESISTVYDIGDDSNYVAYLDVSGDDGKTTHPQDTVFAYDTTQGEIIDNIRYNKETGVAYIPKTVFDDERMSSLDENQHELQAQTLVRYDVSLITQAYEQDKNADVEGNEPATGDIMSANTIPVELSSSISSTKKMAQTPLIGNQFAVKAVEEDDAQDVTSSDIKISINDGAIELDGTDEYVEGSNMPSFSYDSATGDVNVYNVSPSSVMNVIIGIDKPVATSKAARAALATAGEIQDPTDNAYTVGHYGQANASGWTSSNYDATTKTIRRWGPGQSVQQFSDITIAHLSDSTCAYVIAIGSCPRSLGNSWTANGGTAWKADCVHAYYPNGTANPPSGGYYKVLAADWNNQTITVAFFITCNSSGQEGAMVLNFSAPRNGTFTIEKKAMANPYLGKEWQSNVPAAVFGIYNSKAAAQAGGEAGLVKKMTTNSKGIATAEFEDGTYWARELSAPWPYIVSNQIVSFSTKPKSKETVRFYDDTVPPIQISKRIVPSKNSFVEGNLTTGGKSLVSIKTTMSADGKTVETLLHANQDVPNVIIKNGATSVLGNPTSTDSRFDAASGKVSSMSTGDEIIISQAVKSGTGWKNTEKLATICSVAIGSSRTDMSLPLHAISLAGTRYGIYADAACNNKLGETTLDANGIGYYGTKRNQWLESNTTYYVREIAGVNGYSVSSDIYPVTTARNSQVTVSVADSFSTLSLTKESGAGKALTDKVSQFSLKGARYGVFADQVTAELHDASKVIKTKDGRDAIITTDVFGNASEVALGEGTYYVAELPSAITRPWEYGKFNDDFSEPADIDAEISSHDYNSKSNGQFLLDENVYTVKLAPGSTTFQVSQENIPVKIQLTKESTRSELTSLAPYSLEGAVFGVYETEAAAKAAKTGNYQEDGFFVSPEGAVALLYGNKDGLTTPSWELPLKDYYVKELRAPRNYKLGGESHWVFDGNVVTDDILRITVDDFLSSGKYIDGIVTNPSMTKVNEPADVTVQVQKEASEVPDSMKNTGDAMNLAGAKFAVYKSFEDAKTDTNRLMFKTDDQTESDDSKTDFLTSNADGWTNKAVGLPAEECYWVREIEPPHIISDNPDENAKNISESMYVLDTEPVRATFEDPTSIAMTAHKDDAVKPVSITISKYAMSMDNQGQNLHVGEKDENGVPYNDAYTDAAFEGALFGIFETREQAEAATVTDDVNDVSVEQAAYDAGAIRVMTSDVNGVCGTVDNLKWKADGYYVRELKAPTSGCYKRNESILQVGCDRNTKDSEYVFVEIDENKVSKHFGVDEIPVYYYVKIEKTSSDPNVLANTENYRLDGIHFGIYKTREEAETATEENPGAPLYNLYTKEVTHDDGSVHYEAVSGLTGPGVFWAKELVKEGDYPRGFQVLDSPIRVEAKEGTLPVYDATPIVPENSAPIVDSTTGQLGYKTAQDIDKENGVVTKSNANRGRASLGGLIMPTGGLVRDNAIATTAAKASSSIQSTNSDGLYGDTGIHMVYNGGSNLTFITADLVENSGLSYWWELSNPKKSGYFTRVVANSPWHSGYGIGAYNFTASANCGLPSNDRSERYVRLQTSLSGWHDEARSWFYPQILISYNLNGGSWKNTSVTSQTKNIGTAINLLSDNSESRFARTGYSFAGWTSNATNAGKVPTQQVAHYAGNQKVGPQDWNVKKLQFHSCRWPGQYQEWETGWVKMNPVGNSTVTLYATWTPKTYTISYNANGGTGASAAKTATYDAAMPTVAKPTRTGYIFQGYWDTSAATGGTQYYKADGTSARTWNKTANTILYARWTPITYTVKYTATDPDASLKPGMTTDSTALSSTETYDKEGTLKSGLFHKFGYESTVWSYIADDGTKKYLTPGTSKLLNLTAVNNKTVTLTAEWNLNEYWVKFNDGLSTQWGPAPVIESGTNPDTGIPWSIGYQQRVYYDNWSNDGIASDTLTRVRYSHPHFAFKYWFDTEGNKYDDQQAVKNLATPNNVKELTGFWYPAFDYGVDCEANIIVNQPIGGITIQKVVKTDNQAPTALTDLSGIVFELFSDEACTQSVTESTTDEKGIATFTSVNTGQTYYVKEKSIPERLSNVMKQSDEVKEVRAGEARSYEYVNEFKQIELTITKSPSQHAIDTIVPEVLNELPPIGATFAVYATEEDARNDENRLSFYDESDHIATTVTLTRTVDEDGIKCTTATLSGLPNQDLWVSELKAADHGKHEYVKSNESVLVKKEDTQTGNNHISTIIGISNDMILTPGTEASKTISDEDLAKIPPMLREEALELCNGIHYALYFDRDKAAARDDDYLLLFNIENGKFTLSNLPYGTYYAVEYELPDDAIKAGISRSDKVIEINIDETTPAPEVDLLDGTVTKKMYLKKIDADTHEPIAGVAFDIYADDTKSELLCSTSASDASEGIAVSNMELIPGRSYFVQERYDSLPAKYNGQGVGNDNTWSGWVELTLSDTAESAFIVENKKNDEKGSIEVKKASNTGASTRGAVFTVYDASGILYDTMTTDDDGIARLENVPVGSYTVQETTPLELHAFTNDGSDAEKFEGVVYPDQCWNVNGGEAVVNYQGYVKVHKESAAPETTNALSDVYSLAGAVYSLYPIIDGVESVTPLAATLVTDENGNSEPVGVPLGAYKVVETSEPANFSTPMEAKEFYIDVTLDNVEPDAAVVVESKDSPKAEPLANFTVEKRSAETYAVSDGSAQGATNMGKTKFVIEYSDKQAKDYNDALSLDKIRRWYIETDADGRAIFSEENVLKDESDELYRDANGNAALPVGTIVVKEVVPPTGYTIGKAPTVAYRFNGASAKFEELFADSDEVKEWDGNPTFTATNDIYRADISFDKVDAYDENKVMAHIPFLLTLLDENGEAIERHLIATDENGHFSSKTGESTLDTINQNDKWIPGDVANGIVSADFESADSRVWFNGSHVDVEPSAEKGALIYGDYEIREYARPDTEHYQELTPIYFSVRGDNDQSWVEVDGKKVDNGNLMDAIGKIQNHSAHIESTEFTDKVTGTHSMQEESLLATEVIRYADTTAGEKYIFEAYAFDADTKEPITKWFEDVDGETVEVQAGGAYTLECDAESGEVSIDVSFEGYDVTGRKIGLVTKVYHNGVISDIHNEDLTDDAEAVSYSEIGTTATDSDTGQHIGFADGHIDITDVIKYSNLVPGYEYVADGILMDKNTGAELKDAHGNIVTGQTTFVAEARDGEVEVKFSFDALDNTVFDAVVFETLSLNGEVVAQHKDIDDESQTIIYPSVVTTAHDGVTNTAQGNAEGDKVTVIDKIEYANLIAGQAYEARGFLYMLDEQGNKTKIEGSDARTTFTAENADGFIEMTFEAPADIVRGHRMLVGEEIWSDGKIIARHDDAKFENQIVSYPSVETVAADFLSGVHVGNGESARKLVDAVHLEGLKTGETYRIDGIVMARDKQGNITETQVKATETFTAGNSIEEYNLTFELPANFSAENAVVFEKLYSGNEGEENNLLATHEDGNDENQTVHYPKIGTVALHPDGNTHVGSNLDNRVIDTVRYENLVTGYDYTVVGMLVDKETGELIARETTNEDGTVSKTPIISSTDFTPENMDGEVAVSFDVSGIDTNGRTIVVFEQLFVKSCSENAENPSDKTLVATHCDIDDDKQSMFYPSIKTTARDEATGTHSASSLEDGRIIDTVEYTNLIPGYEYEMTGMLMDKASGEPILNTDMDPIVSTTCFTPSEPNGSVEVVFPILPSGMMNSRTAVVFETLSLGIVEMAEHKDITDFEQSVFYPQIWTIAQDARTELHEGLATDDEAMKNGITVIDSVYYSDLVPGIEYTVHGELVDKYNKESMATGDTTFVPAEPNGSVEVVFEMEASAVHGRVMVAFETLEDEDGNIVAEHKDIDDEAQTVSYPKIGTVAHDKLTGTHAGSIENGISIVDTIEYEGLLEGCEYTAYGTLMDKDADKAVKDVDGNDVMSSTTFTASEGGRGSINVEFSAQMPDDYDIAGKTFVAFEKVEESNDEEHRVIAEHEDIDDEAQSIHYPKIRTIARNQDGSKLIPFERDAKIIDTVIYENLVPGVEYVLDGQMINKNRGDALMASGKAVIGQTTFVPETSDGEVEVVFELDGTNTEMCQAVAFETLSVSDAVVAEHADINDEDQTVNVAGVADELVISGTGDMIWTVIGGALIAVAIGGGVLGYRSWKRKHN